MSEKLKSGWYIVNKNTNEIMKDGIHNMREVNVQVNIYRYQDKSNDYEIRYNLRG